VQEAIEDRSGRRHVADQFAPILQRAVDGTVAYAGRSGGLITGTSTGRHNIL
jgi:hypothetical protein